MVVTAQTFEEFVLEHPDEPWEMHRGQLREKPPMSFEHNDVMVELAFQLRAQLDRHEYRVRVNAGHVYRSDATYYIPDVFVLPLAMGEPFRGRPGVLEVYRGPLPLVVEIWSVSTGGYDVDDKLPAYQARGDAEIWRLHPYERTLIAWRRQPDGSYTATEYRGGIVPAQSLPGVSIDLDALFE